jgi:L,D-transpeptidase catalytic domain
MRRIVSVSVFLFSLLCAATAQAGVHIDVDLSSQTMHVQAEGADYDWPVSTARFGYNTPRGHYRTRHLELMHYSRKYQMSPMPHSIFFAGGYAIHGTYETAHLGRPASHGCIRLSPSHAAVLYQLVKEEGGDIRISGAPPSRSTAFARSGWDREAALSHHRRRSADEAFERWPIESADAFAYAPERRSAGSWRARHIIDQVARPSWEYWSD